MRKGELATSPLREILQRLSDDSSTGCLHVNNVRAEEGRIYLKHGLVYVVLAPGRRPDLGDRLLSSGALAPEALSEAMEAQRSELKNWRLSELLVQLGYVDQAVVDGFVTEQLQDSLDELLDWQEGRWRFRRYERIREEGPPVSVSALLAEADRRADAWHLAREVVRDSSAIPVLSGTGVEAELDPEAWALLCKVDGQRSVAELATECGYTLYEATQIVTRLVHGRQLEIPTGGPNGAAGSGEPPSPIVLRPLAGMDAAALDASIARVSAALAEMLGPSDAGSPEPPEPRPAGGPRVAAAPTARVRPPVQRAATAVALAENPGLVADPEAPASTPGLVAQPEPDATVIDLDQLVLEAWAEHTTWLDTQRASAEAAAWPEHVAWLTAERAAIQAEAWEAHAAWLTTDRTAAELAGWAEHAAWLVAQRDATATAAWAEHKKWLAAERTAAAAVAWAEHAKWLAAERAAVEAEAWAEHGTRGRTERQAVEAAAWLEHRLFLATERGLAEPKAWAEHAKWLAAQRAGVEAEARAVHTQWLRAQRRVAEPQAWAQHVSWLAAERAAAEEPAWAEHAGWLAAEQAAVEEAERALAEAQEATRREAAEIARRQAEQVAAASALLAELSASDTTPPAEPAPAEEVEPDPEEHAPELQPVGSGAMAMAEKAALLRELSSLGMDDAAPPPAASPPPRVPAPRAATPRPTAPPRPKRRGLFGR